VFNIINNINFYTKMLSKVDSQWCDTQFFGSKQNVTQNDKEEGWSKSDLKSVTYFMDGP